MTDVLDYIVEQLEDVLQMQVSDSKSKVLAGRPSLAAAVLEGLNTSKLSTTSRSKMLGVDTVGGRRRTTVTFLERVTTFAKAVPRLQALRKSGVNSAQMVRAAGTPAVMYGCEVMGLSDSALHLARTKVAGAAAASAGGKNPALVLHMLDGPAGTMDPAFEAHAAPVLFWATAVWCMWFTREQLALAFQQASLKLAQREGSSCWNLVTGPTAALLASLKRIGWLMPNAFEFIDDAGTVWSCEGNSPGAIAAACRDSVRRWRIKGIGAILPGLIPTACDVGAPDCPEGTVLVDMSCCTHPFACGKGAGGRSDHDWNPAWRHSLVSAAVGGQWTQGRKATIEKWHIEDNRCQLCFLQPGTTQHRFECKTTMPEKGWPAPPKEATLVLGRLSSARKEYLKHRGLLVLRLPAPPRNGQGFFSWLVTPPAEDPEGNGLCWHFDGSMLNGKWKDFRTTGYGIVVTSWSGTLVGYGRGAPPHWCKTAAAAEAWALHSVVAQSPFVPGMRTDCLSLIAAAASGIAKATDPRKALAAIWVLIAQALDGDLSVLADNSVLVWMPAHTTVASIGEAKLSNGSRLSHFEWRANRLADGLAKQAAAVNQALEAVLRLLISGAAAAKHSCKLLGRVTHAANNHVVTSVGPDGQVSSRTIRDSADAPKRAVKKQQPAVAQEKQGSGTCSATSKAAPRQVKPWRPPAQRSTPAGKTCGKHIRLAAKVQEEALRQRVAEVGSTLAPKTGQPTGAERLSALKARVLGGSTSGPDAGEEAVERAAWQSAVASAATPVR